MSLSTCFRPSLAGVALILTLACGGGGGGGSASATVQPGGGSAGTVTVLPPQFAGLSNWVAYQDGSGPWTVATPSGGQYTFTVTDPAGRYGLAVVSSDTATGTPSSMIGSIYHLTRTEASLVDLSNRKVYSTASLSGTLAGTVSGDTVLVRMRGKSTTLASGTTAFSFGAPQGQADLIAVRKPGGGTAEAVLVARDVPVLASGSAIALDFATGWVLQPRSASLSGALLPNESSLIGVSYLTPTTSASLASASGNALSFNAVPAANLAPGDFHVITGQALDAVTGASRRAGVYSKAATAGSLTLPPPTPVPTFGAAGGAPYARPQLSWAPLAGTKQTYWFAYDTSTYASWDLTLSSGWLAGNAAPTYTFPAFTSLAGWNNGWGFTPGATLAWSYYNLSLSTPDPGWYTGGPRTYQDGATFWISMAQGTAVAADVLPGRSMKVLASGAPRTVPPQRLAEVEPGL